MELRRLDDVVAGVGRRISFIKIDAEGHELAILRGSVATLQDRLRARAVPEDPRSLQAN